jgi:hypothetical protein
VNKIRRLLDSAAIDGERHEHFRSGLLNMSKTVGQCLLVSLPVLDVVTFMLCFTYRGYVGLAVM